MGDYHILVATDMRGSTVLHWGVSKLSLGEWLVSFLTTYSDVIYLNVDVTLCSEIAILHRFLHMRCCLKNQSWLMEHVKLILQK